jgi:hypothetical protein
LITKPCKNDAKSLVLKYFTCKSFKRKDLARISP